MRSVQVLVIGAGASGIMAAIEAARAGARVVVIDKMKRIGKKLLATGNGRCNYTNKFQDISCYHSNSPEIAWDILNRFSFQDTVEWFKYIGVLPGNRDGYYYPASFQAQAVLNCLEKELQRVKVDIHTEECVLDISQKNGSYMVSTDCDCYMAKNIILSTGGLAAPVHGSTGDGYKFLKKFGGKIIDLSPALTSFIVKKNFTKEWAGNRIQGKVTVLDEKMNVLESNRGEVQLVNSGISGIPIFQVSRCVALHLKKGEKLLLELDSMPDMSEKEIESELTLRKNRYPDNSVGDMLIGMIPDKISSVIIKYTGQSVKNSAKNLSKKDIWNLVLGIKKFTFEIDDVNSYDKSQVTGGGLSLNQINSITMELKSYPGFFVTGELLDVDGICGGYNLQWAWTTGNIAGKSAAERIKK